MDARTLVAGPRVNKKRCTDFFCCAAFVVALLGLGGMAVFGFTQGNTEVLERFVFGQDFDGQTCGQDEAVKDFPLAYFTVPVGTPSIDPSDFLTSLQIQIVCTNSCPPPGVGLGEALAVTRPGGQCAQAAYDKGLCSWYGATTIRVANYCIDPNLFALGFNVAQLAEDVKLAGPIMYGMPFIAMVVGFIFLYVVHKCGTLLIWAAMIASAVVPAALGVVVFLHATGTDIHDSGDILDDSGIDDLSPDTQKNISYICWAMSALMVILALCLCNTINNVAKVIKGASDFLEDVPSQMLQPLVFGVFQLITFGAITTIFIQVSSVNADELVGSDCQESLANGNPFCIKFSGDSFQVWGLVFIAVMLFWCVCFLVALSHYGTAFAVGEWYFENPDENGKRMAIFGCCDFRLTLRGIGSGLTNHPGSLAFGSLIIAACKIFQVLFFWAKQSDQTPANPVTMCFRRVVDCIAQCIVRFIEFVSEHAYVEIALTGCGFCGGATRALKMSIEHPALFAMVGRVAIAVRLLGMLVTAMATTWIVALSLYIFPPSGLLTPNGPLILTFIIGLVIGEIVMHPLTSAARAALHCFVLDEEQAAENGHDVCSTRPGGVVVFAHESRGTVPPNVELR